MTKTQKAKGLDLIIKNLHITWSDCYEKSETLQKLGPFCPENSQKDLFKIIGLLLLLKDWTEDLLKKMNEWEV